MVTDNQSAAAAVHNEKIHESVVDKTGRAALKEKCANLDSIMRVMRMRRIAIAKQLYGWEDRCQQLEERLEDAYRSLGAIKYSLNLQRGVSGLSLATPERYAPWVTP